MEFHALERPGRWRARDFGGRAGGGWQPGPAQRQRLPFQRGHAGTHGWHGDDPWHRYGSAGFCGQRRCNTGQHVATQGASDRCVWHRPGGDFQSRGSLGHCLHPGGQLELFHAQPDRWLARAGGARLGQGGQSGLQQRRFSDRRYRGASCASYQHLRHRQQSQCRRNGCG